MPNQKKIFCYRMAQHFMIYLWRGVGGITQTTDPTTEGVFSFCLPPSAGGKIFGGSAEIVGRHLKYWPVYWPLYLLVCHGTMTIGHVDFTRLSASLRKGSLLRRYFVLLLFCAYFLFRIASILPILSAYFIACCGLYPINMPA